MTNLELQELRGRLGWSRKQLAATLNEMLGRSYTDGSVGKWERGNTPLPQAVADVLAALTETPAEELPEPPAKPGRPDSAPAPDGPRVVSGPLYADAAYAKICSQFFELIATGVGMIGAAIGSESLRNDGLIIDADKRELGAAWGKLAETNETFRGMLMATDRQGALLAVALATGTTAGRIWRNHAEIAERQAEEAVSAVTVLRGEPTDDEYRAGKRFHEPAPTAV